MEIVKFLLGNEILDFVFWLIFCCGCQFPCVSEFRIWINEFTKITDFETAE